MTIKAIYEKGVFRPKEPVNIPERSEVDVVLPTPLPFDEKRLEAIYQIMGEHFDSGEHDVAERHNEHQP